MGLYLCVFDGDEEIAGLDCGSYEDFGRLRDFVTRELEGGAWGLTYPTLQVHSDCDGEWPPEDCQLLRDELADIAQRMQRLPAMPFPAGGWQAGVASELRLSPANALESFIDPQGAPVVERLRELVEVALERGQPIVFQ